ncbi:MAG: hypothetical protein ACLR06_11565 [Christensenellaceae bacterium]
MDKYRITGKDNQTEKRIRRPVFDPLDEWLRISGCKDEDEINKKGRKHHSCPSGLFYTQQLRVLFEIIATEPDNGGIEKKREEKGDINTHPAGQNSCVTAEKAYDKGDGVHKTEGEKKAAVLTFRKNPEKDEAGESHAQSRR